ncbi:MAG: MFS transporter [Chitinophagales bacterium]
MQTFLIGAGAVLGSWLPAILERAGVSAEAPEGHVANNIVYSFYIGAVVFIGAILVTVFKAKEYPPEEYVQYHGTPVHTTKGLKNIAEDFAHMPKTMRQLGLVQFFSWFALFGMWVFTTPAIAHHIYGLDTEDTSSAQFRHAQTQTGVIFGVYNAVSAIYALCLPFIARKIGRKSTHALSLIAGGIGLISMFFAKSDTSMIFSMIGVGFAWASILAMPYAILAGSIPAGKMGVYMGIFNFFITFPQIINGIFGGPIVHALYNDNAIYALVMSGIFMFCAAISVLYVQDEDDIRVARTKPIG